MTPLVVIAPVCELVPNPNAPILLSAALIVVVALPLLMVRLVAFPATVSLVESPTVTTPLVLEMVRVPEPPKEILPLRLIKPELVVMSPPFQVSGPLIVNAALVNDGEETAAKLWLKVKVPEEVNVTGSLKLKLACEL